MAGARPALRGTETTTTDRPEAVAPARAASPAALAASHAELLMNLGRYADAAALARAWLAGAPGEHPLRLLLGRALHEAGDAEAALDALAGLPPGLPGLPALRRRVGLAAGDLPIADAPPARTPRGRERVIATDDLGETIAFARFLPALAAKERPVIAEVPAALVPVLAGLGGSVAWRARAEDGGPEDATPLDTVPDRLRLPLDRLAAAAAPLVPDTARTATWARRLGQDGYRIGLVWQGGSDPAGALPAATLAPFSRLVGVRLVSLQQGHATADLRFEPSLAGVLDLGSDLAIDAAGLTDLTAILANVDALVAVDSVAAHLAGALGKPVALLVKAPGAGWLWPPGREAGPLYTSVRTFHQARPGDWVTPVTAALDWLQRRRGGAGLTPPPVVTGPAEITAALPVGSYFCRLADIAARLTETSDARVRSTLIAEQLSLQTAWQKLGLDATALAPLTIALGDVARRRRQVLARLAALEDAGDRGGAFVDAARLLTLLERERDRLEQAIDAAGTRRPASAERGAD
jgi:hypothetical protein